MTFLCPHLAHELGRNDVLFPEFPKFPTRNRVGTATSLSPGLPASVTLRVTIKRTIHKDGVIIELVGLS